MLVLVTADGERIFEGRDAARLAVSGRFVPRLIGVDEATDRRRIRPRRRDVRAIRATVELLVSLAPGHQFRDEMERLVSSHVTASLWIPHDAVSAVLERRPPVAPRLSRRARAVADREDQHTLEFLEKDHRALIEDANHRILCEELERGRDFFETVERTPLTVEQATAVATYDNRVRVIAAAGSGKTSVMVARAAYALARGITTPDRILMLAFNADAAAELRDRVDVRLRALGLSTEGLQARTFHSFGLSLIGAGTGRKPSIAPWVERGQETRKISELIDELCRSSPPYKVKWDTFRLLYGHLADRPGEEDLDSRGEKQDLRTFRGETVRSEGERLIANWLFLNGVRYLYEHPYAHDVADQHHAQYRPDFYYPTADLWHEHWALDRHGNPPASFDGYAESMAWKREAHTAHGTRLVETTWYDVFFRDGLTRLGDDLTAHGVELEWDPERIKSARTEPPIEHEALAGLIRSFMTHVKSNGLDRDDLERRTPASDVRSRKFLELYWPVHDAWDRALRREGAVDFDEMLVQAALLVEQDPGLAAYDLVLVDEFQDTSRARARLVKALLHGGGKHLLAVGDDWQAINRFAGADLSVMTSFGTYFGQARTVRLQTTFRCTQTIADVAGRFVSKNPAQIGKAVTAARSEPGERVTVVSVAYQDELRGAVEQHLIDLASRAPGAKVDVLGRYRRDQGLLPARPVQGIDVTFRTIHSSKGLEADYVVLPRVVQGRGSFPAASRDDPVLALAMSEDDGYQHSEERRLMYVALTRARRGVTVFTVAGTESPFARELIEDPGVVHRDLANQCTTSPEHARPRCPVCNVGVLLVRSGRHGQFLGCSAYPRCRHTRPVSDLGAEEKRLVWTYGLGWRASNGS